VEELEGAEETIEDVVGREHAEELDSIKQGGVEDPGRVHSTPGDHPDYGEEEEDSVTSFLVSGIAEQLGELQQGVSAVMDYQHQSTDTDEVGGPGEHQEGDGGVVVDEHPPEIFSLHVKELAN